MYKLLLFTFIVLIPFTKVNSQNYTGFTKTTSGLMYKISKQGKGLNAKPGDRLWVHYIGTLSDSSVFASTMQTGETDIYLGHGQLIKGWEEGLQLIAQGGAITLIVPPHLAYGSKGNNIVPPNDTLTFNIAILQIDKGFNIKPFNTNNKPVLKTKNKLKYIVVEQGTGKNAMPGDNVYVNYTAYHSDTIIFDSSIKKGKPARITVGTGQVIKGWDLALQLMNTGSKYRVIIPPNLAYGKKGIENRVPPKSQIILDIEVVEILTPPKITKCDASGNDTITLDNGIKYIIFNAGNGNNIKPNSIVTVHYSGFFTNGKLFDSSVARNEPIKFPVGVNAVIEGWDITIQLMKPGAKYQLHVPAKLAYGSNGNPPIIPPNTNLIFDIEIIDVIE